MCLTNFTEICTVTHIEHPDPECVKNLKF